LNPSGGAYFMEGYLAGDASTALKAVGTERSGDQYHQPSAVLIPYKYFLYEESYMFKPTYLYVKTHNKTGLKYFGKTVSKDPQKYQGSGSYWKKHIKKHGYDVTTEIIGLFNDEKECKKVSTKFSSENDIVKSKKWANLKEETLDGGWDHIGKDHFTHQYPHLKDMNSKLLEKRKSDENFDAEYKKAISRGINNKSEEERRDWNKKIYESKVKNNSFSADHLQSQEVIQKRNTTFKLIGHQKGEKNSQYGTCWVWCEKEGNKKIKKELLQEYLNKGWEKKYIPGYNK